MKTYGLFVLLSVLAFGSGQDGTRKCLDCICQAATKCNANQGCRNDDGSTFCGPYWVSHLYWVDAGRPGKSKFNSSEDCLKDRTCSEITVLNFMKKWGTDCDGDGKVTCHDYARIHKGGRNGCPAKWVDDTNYWASFTKCMQGKN